MFKKLFMHWVNTILAVFKDEPVQWTWTWFWNDLKKTFLAYLYVILAVLFLFIVIGGPVYWLSGVHH